MRLLIFIAVIIGIAVIFGAVYGIGALLERRRRGGSPRTTFKTSAPDDDPEFLRNLARRLAEEEAGKESGSTKPEDEAENDK
jgi:hypothetical protein